MKAQIQKEEKKTGCMNATQNGQNLLSKLINSGSIGKASKATFESAFNLALGIGLQNFPEGLAVSLPLAAFGHSKFKAFLYGQLSGLHF